VNRGAKPPLGFKDQIKKSRGSKREVNLNLGRGDEKIEKGKGKL